MKIHELLETAADSFNQTLKTQSKKTGTSNSFFKSFKQGVKKGYNQASDFQKELPYTKFGKAAKGLGSFVKQIQKGPQR